MRRSVVPTPERFTRFLPVIVTVLWGMFVFASIYMLNRYESTPGDPGTPVNEWPQKLPIVRQAGKMTLITVVHPRCTCSKASFTELTRAIVAAPRSADIHIVFYYPPAHASRIG
ncbi:MAG: hypothetical protein JNJ69_10275 [Leptospiraceae bacterium]|nr:hypothetical protein [Leptospiraceae bacterium]